MLMNMTQAEDKYGRWTKYLGRTGFPKSLSKCQKWFNWKANALILPIVVVRTRGVLESGGIDLSRSAELATAEKRK